MVDLYDYDYGYTYNTDNTPAPFPDKETSDMNDRHLEALRKKLAGEDIINNPSHYTQYNGLEVIDLTEQMNFNRGNVIKYVARAAFKGSELEDLKKAEWYLKREIARLS